MKDKQNFIAQTGDKAVAQTAALPFKVAVKKRLDEIAAATGRDLHSLRRRVAFEGFLAKLSQSGTDFALKGAFALELRSNFLSRTTKDLDLIFFGDSIESLSDDDLQRELTDRIARAMATQVGDPMTFHIEEIKKDIGGGAFRGIRLFIAARLSGQGGNFERFLIDCVVGDAIVGTLDRIACGEILPSIGVGRGVLVPVITTAQHLAEKIHAYTIPREGENSRVKDLVDMMLLVRMGLDKDIIREAIADVFSHRATHTVPRTLPLPPRSWEEPFKRMAAAVGIDRSSKVTFDAVKRYLSKPLADLAG